jgi:repressor LexA
MDEQPGPGRPPGTQRDHEGLTLRQRAVLEAVRDLTANQGYPPSLREIGDAVGLSSSSSVAHQVNTLQRAGLLRRDPRRPRAYSLAASASARQTGHGTVSVPLLGAIAAGQPIAADDHILDVLQLPTQLVGTGQLLALTVRGKSMTGAHITDGDTVVVRAQDDADHGDIVAALLEDDATVKRLHRGTDGVWLKPENSAYSPINASHARILGKVVAVLRRL